MKLLIIIFLIIQASSVFSQVTTKEKLAERQIITARTISSSVQSGFISSNSFTKLEANNDGVQATANIAYDLNSWIINLNIVQPVTSKEKTKPITLDGLSNKTSFSFGFQKVFWKTTSPMVADDSYANEITGMRASEFKNGIRLRQYYHVLQLSRLVQSMVCRW